jgi:hypothetical protein
VAALIVEANAYKEKSNEQNGKRNSAPVQRKKTRRTDFTYLGLILFFWVGGFLGG